MTPAATVLRLVLGLGSVALRLPFPFPLPLALPLPLLLPLPPTLLVFLVSAVVLVSPIGPAFRLSSKACEEKEGRVRFYVCLPFYYSDKNRLCVEGRLHDPDLVRLI